MNEEQRDNLCDLLPADMVVWDSDEEKEHFSHATAAWWFENLGHPQSGPLHFCCKTCGCATTCTLRAFHDALIGSTIRELDVVGALRTPAGPDGEKA